VRAKAKAKHHTDTDPGWFKREIARLDKLIRESNAAKKLQAATIGLGGLTVNKGGRIRVTYPDGVEGITMGPLQRDGLNAGTILNVMEEDGSNVFAAYRIIPGADADFPDGASFVTANADQFTALGSQTLILGTADAANILVMTPGGGIIMSSPFGISLSHSTTGASANCFIDPSDGRIWRSTSSAEYKQDVHDAEVDPAAVLKMRGITFRDKAAVAERGDEAPTYMGFLAEDLDALGLGGFVTYRDGKPEAIAYDRLSVALLAVLQDQNARLEALEAKAAEA
jgi:hypothetical protein